MSRERHPFARLDLGLCRSIRAESIGQPGHRLFRLHAEAERGTVLLWLDKEDLNELAVAIKRLMEREPSDLRDGLPMVPERRLVDHEFEVASLAIGFDEATSKYVLVAGTVSSPNGQESSPRPEAEAGSPELSLQAESEHLDHLADEALLVCASGRPRCPLCGAPMNQGKAHVCPRSNGHHPQ